MWVALICGVILFLFLKRIFYEDDTLSDIDSSNFSALFSVAKRLEKLYPGSRAYVGIQIPDPDSASRRSIDLVLVTAHEAAVISVENVSGFVSVDKDDNWLCTGKHDRTKCILNPVAETQQLVSVLQEYLEQRGVDVPEGYLSSKVICPNPNFSLIHSDSLPPEVITYDQWTKLKPEKSKLYSGWIKGVLHGGKDKMQDSLFEKLNTVLSTAPISDRLELKGNRYVLGEFLDFKGKQDDLQKLRKIKRSKVGHVSIQKISMFGFANSTVQVLFAGRDYRVEGSAGPSHWEEATVRSSTEIVFQPLNSSKQRKYKLSSVVSLVLSA